MIAQSEREGATAGAEIGPDSATSRSIPASINCDVIDVVHQTTPLGQGLTWGGPGSRMAIVY